jgi:hypothetical protein
VQYQQCWCGISGQPHRVGKSVLCGRMHKSVLYYWYIYTYVCVIIYSPTRAVFHIMGGRWGNGLGLIFRSYITFTPRPRIYVYMYIQFPTHPFHQKYKGCKPTKKTIFSPSTKYICIYVYTSGFYSTTIFINKSTTK